jgi:hypothetical protein
MALIMPERNAHTRNSERGPHYENDRIANQILKGRNSGRYSEAVNIVMDR